MAGAAHGLLDRAAQRVVGGGEVVAAAVPGADGLAGHVVQHPARAGLHAELVDAVAEHVVGVAHDDALLERARRQLLTAAASSRTARWLPSMSSSTRVAKLSSVPSRSWPAQTTRLRATVRKGRPSASKCAVVGVSACAAARSGGVAARAWPRAPPMRCACQVCQGWAGCGSLEVLGDVAADVGVGARVAGLRVARRAGVVDVVGGLLPRVEHDLLVGVVRVQRGDDALDRVVEQHRADADLHAELEAVGGAEERLVLADRLALVVEDGPAAADPARVDHRAAFDQRPGLGLDLLLDLAPEAVGVGEAELDLQALRRQRVAGMGLAGERRGAGGLPFGRVVRVRRCVRRKRSRS